MENSLNVFVIISIIVSLLSFAFAAWLYKWVKARPAKNERIAEIGAFIREGANAFQRKEYILLAKFSGVVAVLIFLFLPSPIWQGNILDNITITLAFIAGAVFSAVAGVIGWRQQALSG